MQDIKESRVHPRLPLQGSVSVSWQDTHGSFRTLTARGIDICPTGVQIELLEPIDRSSNVMIRAERQRLSASASVRYCRQLGPRYRLGLEFTGGYRWHPRGVALSDG